MKKILTLLLFVVISIAANAQLFSSFSDKPRPIMKETIKKCERVVNDIFAKTAALNSSSEDDW